MPMGDGMRPSNASSYARSCSVATTAITAAFTAARDYFCAEYLKPHKSAEHTEPKQPFKTINSAFANTAATNKRGWKRCSGNLYTTNSSDKYRGNVQWKNICTWFWSCVIPRANGQTQHSSAKLVSCSINKSGNTK
jgi:hypothetical protein